jgi:hypothetical protein
MTTPIQEYNSKYGLYKKAHEELSATLPNLRRWVKLNQGRASQIEYDEKIETYLKYNDTVANIGQMYFRLSTTPYRKERATVMTLFHEMHHFLREYAGYLECYAKDKAKMPIEPKIKDPILGKEAVYFAKDLQDWLTRNRPNGKSVQEK